MQGTVCLVISPQTKKASAAFAGAVVLASGAYAVGSQSGDGSATANQGGATAAAGPNGYGPPPNGQMRQRFRQERGQMLSALAKKLGVSQADLRKAMRDVRTQQRRDFSKLLARKLGIAESKVTDALPARPKGDHHRGFGGPGGPPPKGP